MFAVIDFAARKGLGATPSAHIPTGAAGDPAKHRARPGQQPVVRLHKGAFNATQQQHRP